MTGLDHSGIVGVAATMALPPELHFETPVSAARMVGSVFSPAYLVCVASGAGTKGLTRIGMVSVGREGFRYERGKVI